MVILGVILTDSLEGNTVTLEEKIEELESRIKKLESRKKFVDGECFFKDVPYELPYGAKIVSISCTCSTCSPKC